MGMKKGIIESMTGFGAGEVNVPYWGKVTCELRSANHKFLEVIMHLPEGYLSLEDKLKNEIEEKLKRGRLVCVVTVAGSVVSDVFVNERLLEKYVSTIRKMSARYRLKTDVGIDALINLPGVLSVNEERIAPGKLWPVLKKAADKALAELSATRRKEGAQLVVHLKKNIAELAVDTVFICDRFKKSIQERLPLFKSDVERAAFLKEVDITEEVDRLTFHIHNFQAKLQGSSPLGKELDFICQEMQREINTIGAKSSDVKISGKVVQVKSTIEKLREQVQNIE
jgi:uncharacterized protein (TIGR00255 family)